MEYFQQGVCETVQLFRERYRVQQHVGGAASNLLAVLSQPQLLIRLSVIDVQILQRKASLVAVIASYAGVKHLRKHCIENINIRAVPCEEW